MRLSLVLILGAHLAAAEVAEIYFKGSSDIQTQKSPTQVAQFVIGCPLPDFIDLAREFIY
jgi:hypothetical protein